MNRNLDGSPLSLEDLVRIADESGVMSREDAMDMVSSLHNDNLAWSRMNFITRAARLRLFQQQQLRLDTRSEYQERG